MVGYKIENEKRIVFQKGQQSEFIDDARKKAGLSWTEFARHINVNNRSLNNWKREEYSLPRSVFKKICGQSDVPKTVDIETREPFWSTRKAGKIAGKITFQRYGVIGGDQKNRKKKWQEWWTTKGQYLSKINRPLLIHKPRFSKNLAEFVGIILGDGAITPRQVTISLHHKEDVEYGKYVSVLIKKLFKVRARRYHRSSCSVNNYVVSRTELVKFCTEKLGMRVGSKVGQQVDIPDWIKKNKNYSAACLRGLFDTDGSIYNESHNINHKIYCYPRLTIVNHSIPLTTTIYNIFEELNFHPKFRKNNKKVQLERRDEIIRYFLCIKSKNKKHLGRYKLIMEESDSGLFQRS